VPGKNPHDDLAFALHDGGKKFFRFAHMMEYANPVFERILQFSQSRKMRRISQHIECWVSERFPDNCIQPLSNLIDKLYL
jgi:hypothetical protein